MASVWPMLVELGSRTTTISLSALIANLEEELRSREARAENGEVLLIWQLEALAQPARREVSPGWLIANSIVRNHYIPNLVQEMLLMSIWGGANAPAVLGAANALRSPVIVQVQAQPHGRPGPSATDGRDTAHPGLDSHGVPHAMEHSAMVACGDARSRADAPMPPASDGRDDGLRASNGLRYIALLSLFSGICTDFHALVSWLSRRGQLDRLCGGWFVELDRDLAQAVDGYWRAHRAQHGCPPLEFLASDVWDLVRNRQLLRAMVERLPPMTLLLVSGGSPCIDLTRFGLLAGLLGLTGTYSRTFFAFHYIITAIQAIRSDISVHYLVENVSDAQPQHRDVMSRTLCVQPERAAILDARRYGLFARRRWFASSLSPGDAPFVANPRGTPWEDGWQPHHQTSTMPTMMRSRNRDQPDDPFPLASTYQYAPRYLLYQGDLAHRPLPELIQYICGVLPTYLRQDWIQLAQAGSARRINEDGATRVARWIAVNGRSHGFRTPSVAERARAYGMHDYMAALQLNPRIIFDAQGNMFDPDCWLSRVAHALAGWLDGTTDPGMCTVAPLAQVWHDYRTLVDWIRSQGATPCCSFLPDDLAASTAPSAAPITNDGATAAPAMGIVPSTPSSAAAMVPTVTVVGTTGASHQTINSAAGRAAAPQ